MLVQSHDHFYHDLKQQKDPPFLTIRQDGKICSILGKLSPGDVITMSSNLWFVHGRVLIQ